MSNTGTERKASSVALFLMYLYSTWWCMVETCSAKYKTNLQSLCIVFLCTVFVSYWPAQRNDDVQILNIHTLCKVSEVLKILTHFIFLITSLLFRALI